MSLGIFPDVLKTGIVVLNMSFLNKMNKRGPRIEPWGTPDLTGRASEVTPPITTCCVQPWR